VTHSNPLNPARAAEELKFLEKRTPLTTADEAAGAFARLTGYRDGGVFVASFAGHSEWERHPVGDELVMVLRGETRLILLEARLERTVRLAEGELLVVPIGTWHRFETDAVQLLTVTPQPTDHYQGPGLPND
jgi:mannose-6-phosphate isomerase-like protein (cupin superfamily)